MRTHVERAVVVTRDRLGDGTECFIAEDPALPGCVSYGKTREEALEMLEDARRGYLRVTRQTSQGS